MATEKRSISKFTDIVTDMTGKGDYRLAIEQANDLGNPLTSQVSFDVLTAGFLQPDEIGNTDFGGFNATGINILTANTIQSYDTGKVSIDSPLEGVTTEKQRILPFAYFREDIVSLVGTGTPLLTATRLQDSVVFTNQISKVRIPAGKLRAIQILIDGSFDNNCSLQVNGTSYNEGTDTETIISSKILTYSDTANLGILNGSFSVDFTAGVLTGEDLLLSVEIPEAVNGIFSITIQGFQ